ncbi:HSP20-like chaperone [Glomus cerebriforme]|uniref:HSP20-like chaperone n=1 Tax=Glomus cerebriforme TaxID=658196 RepID=A0A397TDA9_9GLOM|nr:HSP20-like chaperone [Glomus cerebriforme]
MSLINNYDLDDSVSRIFDDLIKDLNVARRRNRPGSSTFTPAIDVHENEKEFIVNAELPGLKKDQINVDVHDNTLVISGEMKQDEKYKEGSTHIRERRYGSFTRGITLPPNVKPDDITAKFENGLLELMLPKSAPIGKKIIVE